MTVEEAQERTNQSMSFAVQHFYSPELDWKVGGYRVPLVEGWGTFPVD